MQLGRWLVAWGVGALLAYSACAFPDFQYEDSGEGGSGGTSAGPTTTTSGGGASACTVGELGACGEGQKCTIVNMDTGEIGCGLAGGRIAWDVCSTDGDCEDGTWCDLVLHACKPFCINADACVFTDEPGECIPALKTDMTPIPGTAKHCTAGCEPITANPCVVNNDVTCVPTDNGFDCARDGNIPAWSDCRTYEQCNASLVCGDDGLSMVCRPWCTPPGPNNECPTTGECVQTTPQLFWNGMEYGFCL
jgi:hypothetical protein